MKDETGEILTLEDVAAYLKVGKRTVYRLAAAKKIPAFLRSEGYGASRALTSICGSNSDRWKV
ncbi:helix-turn-helix transcriptional regulator [Pseudomonas monsensis]|jgi:excisionase family DNA binding protein